jgi:hypothetical protein
VDSEQWIFRRQFIAADGKARSAANPPAVLTAGKMAKKMKGL